MAKSPANGRAASVGNQMSARNWIELLLLGAIWGGSFYFVAVAVREIPPVTLVLLRVAIAALALNLYLAVSGGSFRPIARRPRDFLILALLNNVVPFTLIFTGQTALAAGLAAVLNATTPFWTSGGAHFLTSDDRLSPHRVAGILLGIAGICVMILPGLESGAGGPVWAKLMLVGAACSYAAAAIFARRFRGTPPAAVAAGQLTMSTCLMLPVALTLHGVVPMLSAPFHVWAAVLGLALLSTAFGYVLYFRLLGDAGATNVSLVTMIVPVSAILLGVVLLGERLHPFEMAGIAIIAAGLVVIDGRLLKRR